MDLDSNQSNFISLLEKAANSSSEGITVSIMSGDRPLIYANSGFERLTGYSVDEAIGKNCRFLQGQGTDESSINEIRNAIRSGEECTVEILNYKKDGTPFWNRLSITPLKDATGKVTHYVGVQSDITELKETKARLERANEGLEVFHERITAELEQASKAQQFILPDRLPSNSEVEFAALYRPMGKIGGDYYNVIELDDGIYGVIIADVTGHGIPAALLTYMVSFAFNNSAQRNFSTAQVVSKTNQKLVNRMPKGAFITMFYAIYNSKTKVLTYTQAGHPQGIIIRNSTREALPLTTKGGLVGVFKKDKITFESQQMTLRAGDKLIMYTDAIVETRNAAKQMIEMNELNEFFKENCNEPISVLFDKIYEYGVAFSGKQAYDDDFTLVGFEVLA